MKQEIKLNKIVGITKHGEVVMLQSVFNYTDGVNGKPFHGACYASFVSLTQDEVDARNDIDELKDNYDYLWKEAVKSGETELGLDEYLGQLLEAQLMNGEGEFFGHDTSYIYDIPKDFIETFFQNAVTFECIGGGRSSWKKEDFEIIVDQEAFEMMLNIESDTPKLSIF